MTFDEYNPIRKRLETAMNRSLTPEQNTLWYEKFKSWTRFKFSKVIEQIIDEGERFPAIGTIFKLGQSVQEVAQTSARTHCHACGGSGAIRAAKDGYKSVFRCRGCRNWEGKLGEAIPLWEAHFRDQGYKLEWDDTDLDSSNPSEVESLRYMLKYTPKVAERIFAKHPAMRAVVGKVEPEQVDYEKENSRRRSLSKDRERDAVDAFVN